ncbi:hypothetical protein [Bradyrhizobium sp. 169]|uniref:glutamine amidotransferase-related protein n=1 Tax=Bradyrhizobium sp. 169 TaxID=2782640 RepID=UPI001FFABB5D|nr:hypothetical protein [Bradyrhizobium sp. 169]MCK1592109.1 hypothetical protein [Bradyrhizobium sp. 169]
MARHKNNHDHRICVRANIASRMTLDAIILLLLSSMSHTRRIFMALAHRYQPTYGVQFHPQSIITEQRNVLLMNFLRHAKGSVIGGSKTVSLKRQLRKARAGAGLLDAR